MHATNRLSAAVTATAAATAAAAVPDLSQEACTMCLLLVLAPTKQVLCLFIDHTRDILDGINVPTPVLNSGNFEVCLFPH